MLTTGVSDSSQQIVKCQHYPIELTLDRLPSMSTLGSRIEQARKAKGLSKRKLEEAIGVSQGYLSRLTSGERGERISDHTLRALAKALEVTPDWLSGSAPTSERRIEPEFEYDSFRQWKPLARAESVEESVIEALSHERLGSGDPGLEYWWKRAVELAKSKKRGGQLWREAADADFGAELEAEAEAKKRSARAARESSSSIAPKSIARPRRRRPKAG